MHDCIAALEALNETIATRPAAPARRLARGGLPRRRRLSSAIAVGVYRTASRTHRWRV
jgi:hypothetical protein